MNGQQIDKLERRFTSAPAARPHVTRNRDADSAGRIQGYASIWYDGSAGSEYVLPSGLREHVVRGAFSDTIKSDRIACLFNTT